MLEEQMNKFPGRERLVEGLDHAVGLADSEAITGAVQGLLVELIKSRSLDLPQHLKQQAEGRYARNLVYKSPEHGYTVVAMVWGPGQGTALHDHSGTWCVEGVVEGEITVTQYELLDHEGDRWKFRPQGTICSLVGSAGSLIPPFEYHTIANARQDGEASVTLHVYGRELDHCGLYEPTEEEPTETGWYAFHERALAYDNRSHQEH